MIDAPASFRSGRFLTLYALANMGGVLAFLPLLTLYLPLKIEAVAVDQRLGLLTLATLAGAVAASLSNVLFGHLSDGTYARRGSRKRWIAAGLIATVVSYGAIFYAGNAAILIGSVVAFQIALNMMLAPLFAMMADEVPDAQKGLAGGLLALAQPAGSIVGGVLVQMPNLGEGGRFIAVCVIVSCLILPLLIVPTDRRAPECPRPQSSRASASNFWLLWIARLTVQVAGNVLFTYLLFYFESLDRAHASLAVAGRVGHVTGLAFLLAVPIAIGTGRLSDSVGTRKPFLFWSTALAAFGLAVMSQASGWSSAILGYAAFACGSQTFLSLHSAYAMQILPSPMHRGRDLGVLNLTNTLPALLGPALTWVLAGEGAFGVTLTTLGLLTLIGGGAVLATKEVRGIG